jgi:hypothetical protein
MSNSIHFEQLFERFLSFSIGNLVQPEKEGEGSMGEDSLLERVTTVRIAQALADFSAAFEALADIAGSQLRHCGAIGHQESADECLRPGSDRVCYALRGRARNRLPRLRRAGLSLRRGGRFVDADPLSAQPGTRIQRKKTHLAPVSAQAGAPERGLLLGICSNSGQLLMRNFPVESACGTL